MWQSLALIGIGIALGVFASRRMSRKRTSNTRSTETDTDVRFSNEKSLGEILDSLPMGIVVVSSDGQDLVRNVAARSVTGARHADVLIDVAVERLLGSALRGIEGREDVPLAGPPSRTIEIHAIPLANAGAVALIEDATERRRLDQVRTDFVANVSHELKTPVGAISVLAETLEGETTDELVLRLSHRMVLEAQRMSRTIDDLLELSRIEMGGEMLTAVVDMNDVVKEAIERIAPIATRRDIPIEFVAAADSVKVKGDYFQLISAVSNLIENAVKYSEDAKQVDVRTSLVDDRAILEVIDHGVGIPAESLDRIFERFYRVDRARSRGTGGTGLGLSIVRHVATNHGGDVSVRSREGEGSTFTFALPCFVESTRSNETAIRDRVEAHE